MADKPGPDLPEDLTGNELAFGSHTISWYRWAAWFSQKIYESHSQAQLTSAAQAFAILCKGDELGLPPFASWSWIYTTKAGRLAIMSKGALAVVQSKPAYGGYEERIEDEGKETMRAVAIATRKGFPPTIKEFSLEDAEKAGLLKERRNRDGQVYDSTYQAYLKDMLLSRVRGRVLDIAFAAELGGIVMEGIAEDADRMAAQEPREPKVIAGPPRRDPLLAAVGRPAQLGPGTPQTFQDLERSAIPELNAKLQPGVSPEVFAEVAARARADTERSEQMQTTRGAGVAVGSTPRATQAVPEPSQPAGPPPHPSEPEEIDPALVQVITEQVDEMYGPSTIPGGAPPAVQPSPAKPAVRLPPVTATRSGKGGGKPPKEHVSSKFCPRCKFPLNAMDGCDVCGHPGKDIR